MDENTYTAFLLKELADIVGDDKISADSSFLDVGGDSLRAILLASAIEDEYGVVLDVVDVFEAQSLRDIGALIAAEAPKAVTDAG
ncbi:acyl carrier protein [Streptomyces canus]|uniref:acyl carrier protein n=1 Tax=Streptomyces canus TaxID=58343 RepID=UPI0030E5D79B